MGEECVKFELWCDKFMCKGESCWGVKIPTLKCLASSKIHSFSSLDLIIKCRGHSLLPNVYVNSIFMSQVSDRFNMDIRRSSLSCHRKGKLVWIIPRRFRYDLEFLRFLLLDHYVIVSKEDATWLQRIVKWMKIKVYEYPCIYFAGTESVQEETLDKVVIRAP